MAELFRKKRVVPGTIKGLGVVIIVAALVALVRLYEFEKPQVSLISDLSLLGNTADITIAATDQKSGIKELQVFLVQGQKKFSVHKRKNVRQGYLLKIGPEAIEEHFTVDTQTLGFTDGRADLVVSVRDFSFWQWMEGNESTVSFPVVLDTEAPKVWVVDSPRSMRPGSTGVVIYRLSEPVTTHGIKIDDNYHPGFAVPSRGDDIYGAMIALPYDTESVKSAKIEAFDKAGNLGRSGFGLTVRKTEKKHDRINVSERFLNTKMPEFSQYYPEMLEIDSQLDQYLYVNNKVREMNAEKIREICSKSSDEILWEGPFKRMRRSSRRAGFADYRSYYYEGRKIDEQVHLGVDLASVRQADVEASNRGIVVAAEYVGIYGHMVILDHGTGVFSLYSHMSRISVQVGDQVEKGTVLGNTGATGMAGGDHLHFSILINGVFVNPLEWWDKSWIELHILNYLSNPG